MPGIPGASPELVKIRRHIELPAAVRKPEFVKTSGRIPRKGP